MSAVEAARGLVVQQLEEFSQSLSADLVLRQLPLQKAPLEKEEKAPVLELLRRQLRDHGLGGEAMIFSAESRKTPVGLRVENKENGAQWAAGLYLPKKEDTSLGTADDIQQKLNAATEAMYRIARETKQRIPLQSGYDEDGKKVEPGDGLIAVTTQNLAFWKERGLFPRVHSDHSSHATAEDEAFMRRTSDKFLDDYVAALLTSIGALGLSGLKPSDLVDPHQPVRQIGKYLHVQPSAFVRDDHASMRVSVQLRDEGRCSFPLMAQMEHMPRGTALPADEVPTCGRNLVNFYSPVGPGRHRVRVGEVGAFEINHLIARGLGTQGGFKLMWKGIIPKEFWEKPEQLIEIFSCSNISAAATIVGGVDLSDPHTKAEVVKKCVELMPHADRAINNMRNLAVVDQAHHHHWYHPDEGIMDGVCSMVCGVNSGELGIIPIVGTPKFGGWTADYLKRIRGNEKIVSIPHDWGERIDLLKQARMLVGMAGMAYWNDVTTQDWVSLARHRTRKWKQEQMEIKEADIEDRLRQIRGEHGASIDQIPAVVALVGEAAAIEKRVESELHPRRSGRTGQQLLKQFGIAMEASATDEPVAEK